MKIIDGKKIAEKITTELKGDIAKLNRPPGLAVVLIGDDPASQLYVKTKKKAAGKIGINFSDYLCDSEKCHLGNKEVDILQMIDFLNKDSEIDGIIIQLPLPDKFNTEKIIEAIDPKKDVDGFHPANRKQFLNNQSEITPPLIGTIIETLNYTKEDLKGKNTVIVSKNSIFSNPLEHALKKIGLNTQIVNPTDKNLTAKTKLADVLIVIVGKKNFIKKTMVKSDAIVIDVGTNLIGPKKWAGDVDPKVAQVAKWLTPVPGGIGPITVAMLLKNVYKIAKNK